MFSKILHSKGSNTPSLFLAFLEANSCQSYCHALAQADIFAQQMTMKIPEIALLPRALCAQNNA